VPGPSGPRAVLTPGFDAHREMATSALAHADAVSAGLTSARRLTLDDRLVDLADDPVDGTRASVRGTAALGLLSGLLQSLVGSR